MDNEQIKRFDILLFEGNQNKSKQFGEMTAWLDEIGKDLKDANRKIDSFTDALLKANSKAEKAAIECKLRDKEYKTLEKKCNALIERFSFINAQVYASLKSLKGIDRKKECKRKAWWLEKECQHLHTGRLRTVCRIWTGTLLCRTFWTGPTKVPCSWTSWYLPLKKIAL